MPPVQAQPLLSYPMPRFAALVRPDPRLVPKVGNSRADQRSKQRHGRDGDLAHPTIQPAITRFSKSRKLHHPQPTELNGHLIGARSTALTLCSTSPVSRRHNDPEWPRPLLATGPEISDRSTCSTSPVMLQASMGKPLRSLRRLTMAILSSCATGCGGRSQVRATSIGRAVNWLVQSVRRATRSTAQQAGQERPAAHARSHQLPASPVDSGPPHALRRFVVLRCPHRLPGSPILIGR